MASSIGSLKQQQQIAMDQPPGGYDVELLSIMPNKYKCPLCNLLMRSPIQTMRGEMACESCYIDAVKSSSDICPIDGDEIEKGQNGEIFFKDNHARRTILQLECYCPNRRNQCPWQGAVNDVESHSVVCEFKDISCTQCNDLILRKDEEYHMTQDCKFRKISCQYCSTALNAQSLPDHEGGCHMKPMQCPYSCGESTAMGISFTHIKNCSKIKNGITCPYSIVGCGYQPQNSGDLHGHMLSDGQRHVASTIMLVTSLNQTNERIRQELLEERRLREEMAKTMEQQTAQHLNLSTEINKIRDQLSTLKQEGIALTQKCEVSEARIKEDIEQIDTKLQQQDLQGLQRKVDEVKAKYENFEERIRTGGLGGGSAGGPGGVTSEEMKQINEKINVLERGSAVLSANLSDLELKLQLFENTSYTGKQLWKVDNVIYRMNQAVTGKVTALHSAPCFQKMGGYKFCTRLYLNGDGMGRGTHVSLFFVVMKSEHDALLQWPFSERVTFRLINPYNQEESLKESFIPDKNSSSFKRPTKDMNIAAGCPMFLRKDKLPQFIMDDVIYIECSIGSDSPAQ